MRRICLTNDVETTSIINGGLRDETGVRVWQEGLPLMLDLYAKYNIKATFFFIARFAKQHPEIVRMVQPAGHEVALHGLTHDHRYAFDSMSLQEQIEHLKEGKHILEDIAGEEVVSFRSPALRVNQDTARALREAGFRYDSSIAPQRLDIFLTLGSKHKLQWLAAPRAPYITSENNLARKQQSNTRTIEQSHIKEVPVSSFGVPYIGTAMRVAPHLNRLTRRLLYWETKDTDKVVNFLIHPIELITEPALNEQLENRSGSYIAYLIKDRLRHSLKQRNLGHKAVELFEEEIRFWQQHNYQFMTVRGVFAANGTENLTGGVIRK